MNRILCGQSNVIFCKLLNHIKLMAILIKFVNPFQVMWQRSTCGCCQTQRENIFDFLRYFEEMAISFQTL